MYQLENCINIVRQSFILSLSSEFWKKRILEEKNFGRKEFWKEQVLTITQFPDRFLMVTSGGAAMIHLYKSRGDYIFYQGDTSVSSKMQKVI